MFMYTGLLKGVPSSTFEMEVYTWSLVLCFMKLKFVASIIEFIKFLIMVMWHGEILFFGAFKTAVKYYKYHKTWYKGSGINLI